MFKQKCAINIENHNGIMNSQSIQNKNGFFTKLRANLLELWSNLNEQQQSILKKIWQVISYKWQWQIALNSPFLLVWILDQTIPVVHSFDIKLIALLPIPSTFKTLLGFN